MRELLALTGDREVDVHAGGKFHIPFAFMEGYMDVMRELLSLTGRRAIPLQARLEAGEVAVQAAKDAVWLGTCTRQGRSAMLLLRAARAA